MMTTLFLILLISIMCWIINVLIYLDRYVEIFILQKQIEFNILNQMENLKRDALINDFRFDGWKSNNECKITFIPKIPLQYINIGFTISPTSTNFN